MTNSLPDALFKILACPVCKASLKYTEDKKVLICTKCLRKYLVKDDIAVLLPSEHED